VWADWAGSVNQWLCETGRTRRSLSPQRQPSNDISSLVKKLKAKGIVVYTREENVTDNIDWDTIAGYDDIKKVRGCSAHLRANKCERVCVLRGEIASKWRTKCCSLGYTLTSMRQCPA
jgi:hypothetical protein